MKGEQEAMKIFELIQRKTPLPTKIEDLVPLSFMGQAAIEFYRAKIKLMSQLKMAEDQRTATLADGQDAGEMLLNIEARIGEIATAENKVKGTPVRLPNGKLTGTKPSGKPPKHERLGIDQKRMHQSQQIFYNPDAVKRVLKEARENMDIPTKTAVLSEIRHKKAMAEKIDREKTRTPTEKKPPTIDKYVNEIMDDIDILESKFIRVRKNLSFIESSFIKKTLKGKLESLFDLIQEAIGELE